MICDRLKVAQSRKKSYADSKRKGQFTELETGFIFEYPHFEELSALELRES